MVGRLITAALVTLICFTPQSLFAQMAGYPSPLSVSYGANVSAPEYYYGPTGMSPMLPATTPGNDIDYGQSPLDDFLTTVAKSTWVRLEYLSWTFPSTDDALLGAPVQGILHPSEPFPITIGNEEYGTVRVPTLSSHSFRNTQGFRGTLGVPLREGSLEAIFLIFQPSSDEDDAQDIPDEPPPFEPRFAIATSTLTNGEMGTNLFRYDRSYISKFSSNLWGSEINYVVDPYVPGEGLKLRPLLGFRFLNIRESLTQIGEFDDEDRIVEAGGVPLKSTIDTYSRDYIYAPQIGARLELVHRWFTIGFEPKISFGVNTYKSRTNVDNLRFEGDPLRTTSVTGTKFSPVGSLALYAKVNVNQRFSLFFQYDWMLASNIARPYNTINYNDEGAEAPLAGIVATDGFVDVEYQGISFGGEFRWK